MKNLTVVFLLLIVFSTCCRTFAQESGKPHVDLKPTGETSTQLLFELGLDAFSSPLEKALFIELLYKDATVKVMEYKPELRLLLLYVDKPLTLADAGVTIDVLVQSVHKKVSSLSAAEIKDLETALVKYRLK